MKIRVRIAVAVDSDGKWYAIGWGRPYSIPTEKEAMNLAVDGVDPGEARYWICAELDVPIIKEIKAEIEAVEYET